MQSVETIIEQALHLSVEDRLRLVEELEESLAEKSQSEDQSVQGPYARSLVLSRSVHTDFRDVSSDKYKHLAEAYADRDQER